MGLVNARKYLRQILNLLQSFRLQPEARALFSTYNIRNKVNYIILGSTSLRQEFKFLAIVAISCVTTTIINIFSTDSTPLSFRRH